jgi:hypothetical protein
MQKKGQYLNVIFMKKRLPLIHVNLHVASIKITFLNAPFNYE